MGRLGPVELTTSYQTISFLKRRLAEVGVRLKTQHGQNFLIDLNLLRLLAETADLSPDDVVLEVGTGTGALTTLIAERVAAVVTVEIDPQLHQLASEELIDFDNVTQLQQDALESKHTLDPAMMATVAARLAEKPGRRFKFVANLPYSVATPVDRQPAGRFAGAGSDDRHDPARVGRADRGSTGHEGLRGAERVGAEPVPGAIGAADAAGGVLATAESDVGHRADSA